jgi:hypothetical protein
VKMVFMHNEVELVEILWLKIRIKKLSANCREFFYKLFKSLIGTHFLISKSDLHGHVHTKNSLSWSFL